MEVLRAITFYFIVCVCAHTSYTNELDDENISTTIAYEEPSNRNESRTGNINGTITAHRDGSKLTFKIQSLASWGDEEMIQQCIGSKPVAPVLLKGDKGEPGRNGTDAKGDCGMCDSSGGERATIVEGSKKHPLISCSTMPRSEEKYVNRQGVPFKVFCKGYKTCIIGPSTRVNSFELEDQKVWLSSREFTLKKFYGLTFSQLSYLITTTNGFNLEMKYKKEIEKMKILSWNANEIDIDFKTSWKSCKSSTTEEGEFKVVKIECPHFNNYLPTDFYVEASSNKVSIELISLCFT